MTKEREKQAKRQQSRSAQKAKHSQIRETKHKYGGDIGQLFFERDVDGDTVAKSRKKKRKLGHS